MTTPQTAPLTAARTHRTGARLVRLGLATLLLVVAATTWRGTSAQSPGPCEPPNGNAITCENALPGAFPSEWDVEGAGDSSIQGFATDISVNKGETIGFKIDTDAAAYRLDIYRMGYYGGRGARLVATVLPSAPLPQNQPDCLTDDATGLIDCGNWALSATWDVPATAVSGIYFARAVRLDTGGASHIVFVVRDDEGGSDLLFQTSDTTWQAYNDYGGNSLYTGGPGTSPSRAYKVSYNRPFTTRANAPEDWLFNAEYPMVRFLEANGYDVSYTTGVDSDRRGAEILEHRVFLSVGHDEYWSGAQRAAVEAARDAGVHLAFFSGNEMFWKTRWEPSIAPGGASHRTLVSYKETHANAKIDPAAEWTGAWRDPRFSPPADGGRPENALTGTSFTVNCCTYAIEVPAVFGSHRFWRNTTLASLAPGTTATLPDGTLGYEWDEDLDNGFRPAGLTRLSETVVSVPEKLQDFGSSYSSGTARHALTLYKHTSGALVFGAGTVQWSWGLDGEHDRGGSETSLDMQQATVNLLADMGVQPMSLQPLLVPATASDDTIAPVSSVTSPANGATVPHSSTVTITGTAVDVGGIVAAVEVSVDGGVTWHRASGGGTWSYSWQTGTAGAALIQSRAIDDSGNVGEPSVPVSVTIGDVPFSCPCSIWSPAQAPSNPAEPDAAAVELGLKFRASVNGYISGVRFYKSAQNTGPHVANLWTATGVLLQSATFTDETASGWQQVDFPSAVEVDAGTTYVVSYHTTSGFYAQDVGAFAGSLSNGPLTALADGDDGANGVFRYGASGFPTQGSGASNYWVDVVFVTSAAPDMTPPSVATRSPAPNASSAAAGTVVRATFTERLNPATINAGTFQLHGPGGALVDATVTWDEATRTATLDPSAPLDFSTQYTATIAGGSGGVADLAGNPMPADVVWSFTTAAPPPPPPTQGPGGPVLVVSWSGNPFTEYYAEILRAEGLNSFAVADIGTVDATTLAAYDVAILGEMPLSSAQASMFAAWVNAGGNLIAMRPDADLASLLGLASTGSTLAEGYLRIDTSSLPGAGLVSETIQFHGAADLYTLSGATAVALLYSNADTPTGNPAVTIRNVGAAGGTAAAFTFDLARSIVYTRQGNPAWSGQERDGVSPIRSNDLFFGGSEPDYVDLNKVAIPQADEQQRLLANLITIANLDRKPLPRFWYFPHGYRAAIVMTGDDHGNNGTAPHFDWYAAASAAGCSVVDWECVRATSYMYPGTPMSDAQAAFYVANGFELGVHVTTKCSDYTPDSIAAAYDNDLSSFATEFPSVPAPVTNRTHCIAWSDYTSQAEVARANGIRLDTNYYYWPGSWVNGRPGLFTGSGMPMRFARADGTMLDIYQAATQMTDESDQAYPFHADTLLDRALGAEGYYGAFVANMHTDSATHNDARAIVQSAQQRGVPVISAQQLLTWLDGRNGSSFQNLAWHGTRLDFTIAVGAGAHGLQGLVPVDSPAGMLAALTRSGVPVPVVVETIKGVRYAMFAAEPGDYQAHYSPDAAPPIITDLDVTVSPTGAVISWNTSEDATSVVSYGTSPDSLTETASTPGSTLAHAVTISGLTEGVTYYFRVTSVDPSGNVASAPASPGSFTTQAFGVTDTTVADFSAGSPDAGVLIGQQADGELLLQPMVSAEFSGPALPAGWSATPWTAGGGVTITGGIATVSGALLATDTTFTGPRSLELVATFGGAPFQHAGFGLTLDEPLWAIFSTGSGGTLLARTHDGATAIDTPLGDSWLGAPHTYRIDWTAGSVVFSIDGTVVATHTTAIGAAMRPIASDFSTTDAALAIDRVHMFPYVASGTFTSRVLDGGATRAWQSMRWTADVPAGTALAMSVRFGNTPTPDATWTPFVPVLFPGGPAVGNSRYVQYQAVFAGDGAATPVLMDVTVSIAQTGADTTPPSITQVAAAAGSSSAAITWTTSEPATSVVSFGTSETALDQTATVEGFSTSHSVTLTGLAEGTTYYYRVTSADSSGNTASAPAFPASFATSITPGLTFVDTSTSDFSAGTGDVYIAQIGDGELLLTPAAGEELNDGTLPAGWTATPWQSGGGGTVAGGALSIDGARIDMGDLLPPARTLEFAGVFTGAAFQHAGFAITLDETRWAIFSTGSGGTLLARTHNGAVAIDTPLDASLLNAVHRYRIDWTATTVVFSVDDVVVASHDIAITDSLRPLASDLNADGNPLRLDWLHLPPYAQSGTFLSRVFDGGSMQAWDAMAWTATTPPGTTVEIAVRFGDTPQPDASWTGFMPVAASGGSIPGSSRYVQYRAVLTGDGANTPELAQVVISALAAPPQVSIDDAAPVQEGNGGSTTMTFVVRLSRAAAVPVSVGYTTADGTATAGSDYTAATDVITFEPGEVEKGLAVLVAGDVVHEGDETVLVNLVGAQNATLGRSQASGTIVNDDPQPGLSIANAFIVEGTAGTSPIVFTVTLSHASSQTIAVGYATADGTATAGVDYTGASGTLTFAPGVLEQTIVIAVAGDTGLEPDESFTVTLSNPVNATLVAAQATGVILNDDLAPVLAIDSITVVEGTSGPVNATFTVTLAPANPGQTVTVGYATANGSAVAGQDYVAASGTLTFAPGQTSQTLAVPVLADGRDELDETFVVNLTSPVNAVLGTSQGTALIVDADDAPSITIDDVAVDEGDSGSTSAVFTVRLSTASDLTVTVNYATSNGSAIAGQDYAAASGTLTFAPGVTSRTIEVAVLGDVLDEPEETFHVDLSGAVNAQVADGRGVGTIRGGDGVPRLAINDVSELEGDSLLTVFRFTVTMSRPSTQTVQVSYATANGTASSSLLFGDYFSRSGTLTFFAGQTTATLDIMVRGDDRRESNETFFVNLSNPSGALIDDAQGRGVILDDDSPVRSVRFLEPLTDGFAIERSGSESATRTSSTATSKRRLAIPNRTTDLPPRQNLLSAPTTREALGRTGPTGGPFASPLSPLIGLWTLELRPQLKFDLYAGRFATERQDEAEPD